MILKDAYPLVTTERLADCKQFYTTFLGFDVAFEASWFVYLVSVSGNGIAFMSPDHPTNPPGPEVFSGNGIILTLEVDDAEGEYSSLKEAGAQILYPLTDEPWGQRRFAIKDPAGLMIDIVQQTEPQQGYWDKYTV